MRRSPERGVRPAVAANRGEESVRHTPQAVERRASGILSSPSRRKRRAFAAVRGEESVRHSP